MCNLAGLCQPSGSPDSNDSRRTNGHSNTLLASTTPESQAFGKAMKSLAPHTTYQTENTLLSPGGQSRWGKKREVNARRSRASSRSPYEGDLLGCRPQAHSPAPDWFLGHQPCLLWQEAMPKRLPLVGAKDLF